jgi:hypothetical protein
MTHRDLELLCKGMAPAVHAYVAEQIGPLDTRIQQLEQRVRDTENKSVSFRAFGRRALRMAVDRP